MVNTIQRLKKKKKGLLQKLKAEKSLLLLKRQNKLEEKKLRAEIKALQNPGKVQAFNVAKSLAKRSGKLLFKGTLIAGRHLSEVAKSQTRMDEMAMKKKKRKMPMKGRKKRR